jgi:NAD(P)H dehydrogenase (quinone)
MAKMLVCYYSRSGHTKKMAETVASGAAKVSGVTVEVKPVDQVKPKDLLDYDAIMIGSPTYYGTMAAPIKQLFDESVAFHGQLEGKVGGAFSSSANVAGGNETTILDILGAMLIHGMVVQGSHKGDHYGAVAVRNVDERACQECLKHGQAIATLALRLHG